MRILKCRCGGKIKPDKTIYEGFIVGCIKCDKCGETGFSPEQTREIIKLREANKEIEGERKIIKVGDSIAALLPKKVKDYGVKEGIVDSVKVLSSDSLQIKFKKQLV